MMPGTGETMTTREGCRQRCASVAGCAHFSFWYNGRCNLQDNTSTIVRTHINNLILSGTPTCPTDDVNGAMEMQTTENCFRCGTVGSTSTRRLAQNTYIPSFQIPANLLGAVNILVPPGSEYRNVITFTPGRQQGLVQIYVSVVNYL